MSVITYTLLFAMQISLIFSSYPELAQSKCSVWDSGCLTKRVQLNVPAFTSGNSELNSEILDPMHIEHARIDVAGLKMNISNAVLRGYGGSIVDRASVDPILKHLHFLFHMEVSIDCMYNAGGNLLGLPITGEGNMRIIAQNVQMEAILPFDIIKDARGKDIVDLTGFLYWTDFKDVVHYDLSNLFNGDKGMSEVLHQFMNTNWRIVSSTFIRPIFDIANEKLLKVLKTILATQPIDDAFILY